MATRKIEVSFAVPVELTSAEMQIIDTIANDAARRTETAEIVHWAAGCGSKPNWSHTDCAIFGYEPTADSPTTGEPTFNDEIFYVETFARERYDSQPFAPTKRRKSHAEVHADHEARVRELEAALENLLEAASLSAIPYPAILAKARAALNREARNG